MYCENYRSTYLAYTLLFFCAEKYEKIVFKEERRTYCK